MRRALTISGLTIAGAAAAATSAQAATIQASAACTFPRIGEQVITFEVVYPDNLVAGDSVPAGKLTNVAFPAAVTGLGASVELVHPSAIDTTLKAPVGAPTRPLIMPKGSLPLAPEIYGGMHSFIEGQYTATIVDVALHLRVLTAGGSNAVPEAPDDFDGDPGTFSVPCDVPGAPSTTFTVGPLVGEQDRTPPTSPTDLTVSGVGSTTATISWKAASDTVGVDRYSVALVDETAGRSVPSQETSGLQATFKGLMPGTEYRVSVIAIDRFANRSEPATSLVRTSVAPPVSTTPKISNYTVSGGFTIWVEPRAAGEAVRLACITTLPTISLTASGFSGAKLYFQGLWQSRLGFGLPWPLGLLRTSDDGVPTLTNGDYTIDSLAALGLVGGRGSVITADRSALATRGRVTIGGWYAAPRKVFGLTLMVPTFLPTKSASFAFIDKPAGSCGDQYARLALKA